MHQKFFKKSFIKPKFSLISYKLSYTTTPFFTI